MKTLVIYYSFTGKARKAAEGLAQKENADLIEVKEKNTRSKFNAFVFGSLAARRREQTEISELDCDFSLFEKIIIVMPIWFGHPVPAMNNIINMLPGGKEIELVFTSGGGNSSGSAEKTKELIEAKGCKVAKYVDVKSSTI